MKRGPFLWANFCAVCLAALATAVGLGLCAYYLSFAGFAALFGILLLLPGLVLLLAEGLLLLLAARGRRGCAKAAFLLEIFCGVPYTMLALRFPAILWIFFAYTPLLIFGLIGWAKVRETPEKW